MNRKGQATRHASAPLPAWVWLLAGFALGVGISIVLFFRNLPEGDAQSVPKPSDATPASEIAPAATAPNSTPAAETAKEPKYSFYEVLPERGQGDPAAANTDTAPAAVTAAAEAAAPKPANIRYFLQVGSYPDSDKADNVKAQLALLGTQSNIAQVNVNGAVWYRVTTGPYANTDAQNAARASLEQNGFKAIALSETRQ
jgi:cell division protein FtsN